MKKITHKELAQKLYDLVGATFAVIVIEAQATLTQKYRGTTTEHTLGAVTKRSTMFVIFGGAYGNAVNNQLEREEQDADFVPKPHRYADSVGDSVIMQHRTDGTLYVAAQRRDAKYTNKSEYFDAAGVEIDAADLVDLLPKPRPAKDSGRQGTDKAVQWLTPKLTNVVSIKLGGEEYKVVSDGGVVVADIAA
jgi:hypothetical protein